MNNRFHFLVLLALVFPLMMYGQTEQESNNSQEIQELINSHILNLGNGQIGNVSRIQQVGNQNDATIIQELASEQVNRAVINQNGSSNYGYLEQTGYALGGVINQIGSGNQSNIWSRGDQVSVFSEQHGDRNVINSYIENLGIMSRSAMLRQIGNDNRIDLSLVGSDFIPTGLDQPINISQFGNQNSVNALMENFGNPINITQDPGLGGQGMSINISNSAFSFPMRRQ